MVDANLDKLTPLIRQVIADRTARIYLLGQVKVQVFSTTAPSWWYSNKDKLGFHTMVEAWKLDDDMVLLEQWRECRVCGWIS